MRNRRQIKAKHRYAFRFRDRDEERLDFLRGQYRFKNDTEIVQLAIESLYNDNMIAKERAEAAAPITTGAKPMTPLMQHHRSKKGRKQ